MAHAIARLLLEIAQTASIPTHVWATAMLYFFAFCEYTQDIPKTSSLTASLTDFLVGVSCLVLSVKANENFLFARMYRHGSDWRHAGANTFVSQVLDSAARVALSYISENEASIERIIKLKRKMRDFIPQLELDIMRVIGSSLQPESAFSDATSVTESQTLIEVYSNPVCLNFPPCVLKDFAKGRCDHHMHLPISRSIDSYLH